MKLHRLCALTIMGVSFASALTAHASFIVGHYFATLTGGPVAEYDANGQFLGSLPFAFNRGIAFSPDGLLYVVSATSSNSFDVEAFDSDGVEHQSYRGIDNYFSNIYDGHIAVGPRYIYTSGADNVTRFDTLNPKAPGTTFYSELQTPIFDLDLLPNGNLLVASNNYVTEVAPDGTAIRGIPYRFFNNIRGVAFDPTTNSIFVSEIFGSPTDNRLLKFDYTTLSLLTTSTTPATDLFRTMDGHLLVAGSATGPLLYDANLNPANTNFGGGYSDLFVTQFTPEPASMACASAAAAIFLLSRKRR